jgi:hypothetical protein
MKASNLVNSVADRRKEEDRRVERPLRVWIALGFETRPPGTRRQSGSRIRML